MTAQVKIYSELVNPLGFASSLCFLHLGAVQRTSTWVRDLERELESRGLTPVAVPPNPDAIADVLLQERSGAVLFVQDLRSVLALSEVENVLTRMRPEVTRARQAGWRVLLTSTVPADLYPTLSGSSILIDANMVQGRPISEHAAREYISSRGIRQPKVAANIVRHASGSRALLEQFCDIEKLTASGNEKKRMAVDAERDVAARALEEIGPALCTWMEYWSFELRRARINEADMLPQYLLALRSSGLIAPAGDEEFSIFPFANASLWVDSLGGFLESVVEAPEIWVALVSELFGFERRLRRDIKVELNRTGRFEEALEVHELRILELARRDTSLGAAVLDDVRSPLDWLTLSELISIAIKESDEKTGRFLGYSSPDWTWLERELVPIRNRIAHMRLARQGDLETVRKCKRRYDWVATRVRNEM